MSRADRLETLLEQAFARLEDGDLEGAAKKLELARRIDGRNPDVVMLDAELAAAGGALDRALALFEQAAELVPEDATPLISAASLWLYSLDDPGRALEMVDRALERCDDEDALIDAVMIRALALIALDRQPEALEVLGELASSAIDDAERQLAIGDAFLGAGDPKAALRWFARALDDADFGTDALYASGWAHEALGDEATKKLVWREVHVRDTAAPWPEWRLPEGEFERLAEEAFDELSPRARELLGAVPIVIADLPATGMVDDGLDPRVLGLIVGPDRVQQVQDGAVGAPVTIFLYAKNLESDFADPEELAEQIRITVLHETAHYFGLDEEQVAAIGLD